MLIESNQHLSHVVHVENRTPVLRCFVNGILTDVVYFEALPPIVKQLSQRHILCRHRQWNRRLHFLLTVLTIWSSTEDITIFIVQMRSTLIYRCAAPPIRHRITTQSVHRSVLTEIITQERKVIETFNVVYCTVSTQQA